MSLLKHLEQRIHGITNRDYQPNWLSLEQLLVIFSKGYGIATRWRCRAYGRNWLKSTTLECPVISIGNIVAGGTGKTPMVSYLVGRLTAMGYRVAVISRGYGGALERDAAVVGDGRRLFLDAATAGDEPFMMARTLGVPVVVGRDRRVAGQLAMDKFRPDLMVMDDAFQHMKLSRDLDLVLLDHDRPFGNGRLLPAGRLREGPETASQRAHVLILTRCPETGAVVSPSIEKAFPGLPVFKSWHRLVLAAWIRGGKSVKQVGDALDGLRDRPVLLVSGIARNSTFRCSVEALGGNVVAHLEFQDHYRYKSADFETIRREMGRKRAEILLTTEKDWAKFPHSPEWEWDTVVLGVRLEIEDAARFDAFVRDSIF